MTTRPAHPPIILGWREWIALPDLGVRRLKAKLDTGARSSSLHVSDIETFHRSGREWARFRVIRDTDEGRRPPVDASAPVIDERIVRDSGGHEHLRIVVETRVEIAGWTWPVDLTLASRSEMSFRMLLGRQALSGHVVVDPARSYLAGRPDRSSKRRS